MSDDVPHDENPTIIPSATLVTDTDDDRPQTAHASLEKCSLVLFGHPIKVVYLLGVILLAIGLTVGLATSLTGGDEGDFSGYSGAHFGEGCSRRPQVDSVCGNSLVVGARFGICRNVKS